MPGGQRRFASRLGPRDRHEAHRVATPLEVFFDMVAVVGAVAILGAGDTPAFPLLFVLGAALELAVPVWAGKPGMTPWHRHHIIQRYGLLNIIVLGETLLAAVVAIRTAIGNTPLTVGLASLALAAMVTAFALWWLYFAEEEHLGSDDARRAFVWGYGHLLIFATGAAVGAGFAVQVDVLTGHAHVGQLAADLAIAVPVAVHLFGLGLVRDRYCLRGRARAVLAVGALLALATPVLSHSLAWLVVLTVPCVALRNHLARQDAAATGATF